MIFSSNPPSTFTGKDFCRFRLFMKRTKYDEQSRVLFIHPCHHQTATLTPINASRHSPESDHATTATGIAT